MPEIDVQELIPEADLDEAFARLVDFESYPELAPAVLAVDVEDHGDGRSESDWEVAFRRGVMRWREEDNVDWEARTITFRQLSGDLAHFHGVWAATEEPGGVRISFNADFDLGVPSMAEMLDPVAERTLRKNIHELLVAFKPEVAGSAAGGSRSMS